MLDKLATLRRMKNMASQNPGQFQEGSKRAREMGKIGGKKSSGKFTKGSSRARTAGSTGGSK